MRGLSGRIYITDEFGNNIEICRKRKVTDEDIISSGKIIAGICGCYPPNIIWIDGKLVYYRYGLEEGLMFTDTIDKRKLKKEIRRYFDL